ncbi:MAG: uracil-DNA glycosylase, partial [Gammaproteobacteria bacterium]
LGELAYRQILKIYSLKYNDYKFKHGRKIKLSDEKILLSSYHCSRININTGRLKKESLTSVFKQAKIIANEKRVS